MNDEKKPVAITLLQRSGPQMVITLVGDPYDFSDLTLGAYRILLEKETKPS